MEMLPFGVFLAELLLNKPVSVILKSVRVPLNRKDSLRPNSPATSAFPYSTLFGFVNVAELIPNASLTKAGKMSSNVYANASFFGMSTGASGTNKLFRIASIETGYISKASIMVSGQYTNPVTFEIICGDGKVTKIGSPNSSYVKIYKDNNYAYIWLSSSLGYYSRGGVYFNTINASLVKFEDVTSSISVSDLSEV